MANKKAHIITNTTLNVCRLFGKLYDFLLILKKTHGIFAKIICGIIT